MPNMTIPFCAVVSQKRGNVTGGIVTSALAKLGYACGADIWAYVKGRAVKWDQEVDCMGLLCPLPVLRARKVLAGMAAGQVLRVLASDAMAAIDLPHFCAQAGHEFIGAAPTKDGGQAYLIRRA